MAQTRIFLVGGSGVGKTTLAKRLTHDLLHEGHSFFYLEQSARLALQKVGCTWEEALASSELMQRVQDANWQRGIETLIQNQNISFVMDRSLDMIPYQTRLLKKTRTPAEEFALLYQMGVKSSVTDGFWHSRSYVFLVHPSEMILRSARENDRGERGMFLTDEWVWGMHCATEFYLCDRGIYYYDIPPSISGLEDRISFVRRTAHL
jgi:hypothetical protein